MRKKIAGLPPIHESSKVPEQWLNVEPIATVEVTSEDPDFPIDAVFTEGNGPGWRARDEGEQQIRIIFDQPASIRRIHLRFVEPERQRTQEFTLKWFGIEGDSPREIVRQQWNFSPAGSKTEVEDYRVNLDGVAALELAIKPDVARGDALATLAEWRIA